MERRDVKRVVALMVIVMFAAGCASPSVRKLTVAEVVSLSDSRAVAEGYDLRRYNRGVPEYNAARGKWSTLYRHKTEYGDHGGVILDFHNYFTVDVSDKTRRATIIEHW